MEWKETRVRNSISPMQGIHASHEGQCVAGITRRRTMRGRTDPSLDHRFIREFISGSAAAPGRLVCRVMQADAHTGQHVLKCLSAHRLACVMYMYVDTLAIQRARSAGNVDLHAGAWELGTRESNISIMVAHECAAAP
jgi:hypothetical protein